jgi:DNA-binding MarR family transcriptional regulator
MVNTFVTRMIDLLSAEGLVERSPHPSDRRINLLRVTEQGEVELRRIFAFMMPHAANCRVPCGGTRSPNLIG